MAAGAPRRLGPAQLDPVRPVPRPRPGAHRARHADRGRPRRPDRRRARWPTGRATEVRTTRSSSRPGSRTASGGGRRCRPAARSAPTCAPHTTGSPQRESVIVVGGGAAAVSSAANIATHVAGQARRPLLPRRPGAARGTTPGPGDGSGAGSTDAGVRAAPRPPRRLPDGFAGDEITAEPVQWSTGQPPATADAVLWAIGRVRPNTGWLPTELLDEHGFVRVTPDLRVPGHPRGVRGRRRRRHRPAAQLGPQPRRRAARPQHARRSSTDKPLRSYRAPKRRWGSVLGIQPDGLEVFAPNGSAFRFPAWSFERVLMPLDRPLGHLPRRATSARPRG